MKSIKKGCNGALAVLFVAVLVVLAGGCQTTVPVSYTQPGRFDMSGIRKIGIISDNGEVTQSVESALTKTGKYSIASETELNELMAWLQQQRRLSNSIETTASDVLNGYNANQMRANGNYKGKTIKISGTVTEIREDAIRLGVGNDSVDIYMLFGNTALDRYIRSVDKKKARELNKGDTVVMVGVCYGIDKPVLEDMAELFSILGGGTHINVADATFYIPEYTGPVDALFTATTNSSENIESRTSKKAATTEDGGYLTDSEGRTIYREVTEYRCVTTVRLTYRLERVDDGKLKLVGEGSATGEAHTGYTEDKSQLPSGSSLVSSTLKSPIRQLISDLVPTQRTLSVKLAKSKEKDRNVKSATKVAKKLVKAKDYAKAADAYGKIYTESKDWSAGYNQAVLTEVAVGTEQAVALMEALAKVSDKPEVQSMLTEMQRRNAANKRAAAQMAD